MTPEQFAAFMQMLEAIRLAILATGIRDLYEAKRSEAMSVDATDRSAPHTAASR